MREKLAQLAHEQWCGWMEYMFAKCERLSDGGLVIPHGFVERWARQAATPYAQLPELEKESDRKEADRVLALLSEG